MLAQSDLQDIDDHIVEMMFGTNSRKIDELGPQDAADAYTRLRNQANTNDIPDYTTYRLLDDYFDNPLPRLVFYKCNIYGGKIKSRVMMSAYTSYGSDRKEDFVPDEDGEFTKMMVQDTGFGKDAQGFTPPKLGGKQAKDVRRYANLTKSNDELITVSYTHLRAHET